MVPRLHMNLAAPGVNYLRLIQFALILLTAGALTLIVTFWWMGNTLHQQIDAIDQQVLAVKTENDQLIAQAQTAGLDLSRQAIQGIPPQVEFVKAVRERVGFSWTQLLTDLETAIPSEISMTSVSLDEKTDTILLQGSAPSLPDLNRLIHQLDRHAAFQDAMLSQHANKTASEDEGSPRIVFSLKVTYTSKHLDPQPTRTSRRP